MRAATYGEHLGKAVAEFSGQRVARCRSLMKWRFGSVHITFQTSVNKGVRSGFGRSLVRQPHPLRWMSHCFW
jgi:hypothetical protein